MRRTAMASLAVAAIALTSCGGSSEGGSTAADAPATAAGDRSGTGSTAPVESADAVDGADAVGSADAAQQTEPTDADDAEPTADAIPPTDPSGDETADSTCWSGSSTDGDGIAWALATDETGLIEPLTGMHGHATAAGDVDGDGWTDLFVGGFADRDPDAYRLRGADGPSPDRLLRGGPDGFVVDESFVGELARTSGATFGDLDADGDLDLVVVRNPRRDGEISGRPTAIYENEGGSWRLATTIPVTGRGRAVAIVDFDRDGFADLAIAGDRFGDGPTRLYRNDGAFGFSDASTEWGLPDDMFALALAAVDLDGDGWLDLVVSGDERVLLGGPDGFTISVQDSLRWDLDGDEDDPAGIAVGDLDGDGRPDLLIGQHFNSTVDAGNEVPVRLFLNRTDGELRLDDVTDASGIPGLWTKSPHVAVVDVDNDARMDIVTSAATDAGVPFVLRNTGTEDSIPRFEPIGEPGDTQYWVTGAVDDFDRDGRVDVFLVEWEPALESPLFRSTAAAGDWVRIDLAALGPAAVGARVSASHPGDDSTISAAWIESSTGYAAGAPPIAHLGLGDVGVDEVRVTVAPVSGEPIEITVPVNSSSRLGGC